MTNPTHIVCTHCNQINAIPAEKQIRDAKCGHCKKQLLTGKPQDLQSKPFKKMIARSHLPVVVDFWAPWCGPCKAMGPQFALAASGMPQVQFVKLNTENAQDVASTYGIRSIPTMALFKNGKEVARTSGSMDAASIERWIKSKL